MTPAPFLHDTTELKWERCAAERYARLNPNQLVAARPPMCEETEGLCQTPTD